ncbi:MAG: hypothetical protein JSR64_22250 [Nitrospira sp.]|nr:hypothetical protein [Nitrospira sp.]
MAAPPDRLWVAHVWPFPYPEGSAASRRVLGIAQSLSLAGFGVTIASGAGTSGDVVGFRTGNECWDMIGQRA